jgi:hypothetical protein
VAAKHHRIDLDIAEKFFDDFIYVDGHCAEVRVWGARVNFSTNKIIKSENKQSVVSGWFTSGPELAFELSRIQDDLSAYVTVNPVNIGNRPRKSRNNLTHIKKGTLTTDEDISYIRWFIIDIDPRATESRRKKNSSSSQFSSCIEVCNQIIDDKILSLSSSDFLCGCSGNGTWIMVRLPDIENNSDIKDCIEYTVRYISNKYSNDDVDVDVNSKNPSRMLGIPGTVKFKAEKCDHDHPYRRITAGRERMSLDVCRYSI